jgi:hypothetical protein
LPAPVQIVAGEQLHIGGSDVMALSADGDMQATGHTALQGSEVRINIILVRLLSASMDFRRPACLS